MPKQKERRKSRRIPLEIGVSYQLEGNRCSSKTANASTNGFFVTGEDLLPIGITTRFSLTHEEMEGTFEVVGRVVHLISGPRAPAVGMGVQIRQIGADQESHFEQYRRMVEKRLHGNTGK